MKQLPLAPELCAIARRVIWFEAPEKALSDTPRFVAYALTFGTEDDVRGIRSHLTDDDLRAALRDAPPGIFDARSWAFWHVCLGCLEPPPLPVRRIPDLDLNLNLDPDLTRDLADA